MDLVIVHLISTNSDGNLLSDSFVTGFNRNLASDVAIMP